MGLGQNSGVFLPAALKAIEDVFDAVTGVFEFSVEGFVVMMAMILQALEQILREVGSVACGIAMGVNLPQFVHEHALIIFGVHTQGLRVEPGCRPCERVQEPALIVLEGFAALPIDVFLDIAQDCIEFVCLHVSVLGFPVQVYRIGASSAVALVRR